MRRAGLRPPAALYIGVVLIWSFGSALGLYGLIVALIIAVKVRAPPPPPHAPPHPGSLVAACPPLPSPPTGAPAWALHGGPGWADAKAVVAPPGPACRLRPIAFRPAPRNAARLERGWGGGGSEHVGESCETSKPGIERWGQAGGGGVCVWVTTAAVSLVHLVCVLVRPIYGRRKLQP